MCGAYIDRVHMDMYIDKKGEVKLGCKKEIIGLCTMNELERLTHVRIKV